MTEFRTWLLGCGLALSALGCTTTPSDPLQAMHPYIWAEAGQVEFLTCRWTTEQPIGVAILGTDEGQTRTVRRALAAWQGAGLGVRFVEVPPTGAQLVLERVEGRVRRDGGGNGAGRTIADCLLGRGPDAGAAELVHADVRVSGRVGPDGRGRVRTLTPAEELGTWVHEIGHALGFQGHLRRGTDPMRLEPDQQRWVGERLLRGEALESPALEALYRQPSGTTLGSHPVGAALTEQLDKIAGLAAKARLEGPFLRSGDRAARIFWRRPTTGTEYGFLVHDLARVIARPEALVLLGEQGVLGELR